LPHALPHAPQLLGSSLTLVHVPLQLVSPDWQETAQVLDEQTWPAEHGTPAEPLPAPQPAVAPQYWLLVAGLMQLPPHAISVPGQESVHVLATQTLPEPQTDPAEPLPLPQPALAPQY
jgi:hypothetical protein